MIVLLDSISDVRKAQAKSARIPQEHHLVLSTCGVFIFEIHHTALKWRIGAAVTLAELTSTQTQLSYDYYSLPFCQPYRYPDDPQQSPEGVEVSSQSVRSPYTFRFRVRPPEAARALLNPYHGIKSHCPKELSNSPRVSHFLELRLSCV